MEDEIVDNNSQDKKSEKKIILKNESCVNSKDSINWMLYLVFLRGEYEECLDLISKYAKEGNIESNFAIYLKSQIKRNKGDINESLELLRKCYSFNENNSDLLKDIGKNLLLLGKYKMAMDIFDEILTRKPEDLESFYQKGICFLNLKDYDTATACFMKANSIRADDRMLIQLGKIALLQENYGLAIQKYNEALDFNQENPELLTAIGSIYLKLGKTEEAFKYFTNAMNYDSSYSNALMGVGSIYQDKFEYENALINYKLASISNPNSPLVWNNLGLCFFARQKYIAAVTCLKKANYLDPFEWIICYNLGLVYLTTNQFCSAFHYMNCASNFKQDLYLIFMYLGMILSQLNDIGNATNYYDKALELNRNYLIYYNYAVSLMNNDMYVNAREMLNNCIELYNNYRDPNLEYDAEIIEGIKIMNEKLS